jgi:tight adherence protein B
MQQVLLVVVAVIVFLVVIGILGGLWWTARSAEEERARQLARRLGTVVETSDELKFTLQGRDPLAQALGSVGRKLEIILLEAGNPYPFSTLIGRVGAGATLGVVFLAIALRSPMAIVGIFLGAVPIMMLASKASDRATKLSQQLPDALDLVARSLQAGHGFSDALKLCSEEMPQPVAEEFGRVFEENNLGRDLRDCLYSITTRNPRNFDLKLFVSSVLLQRDTGGNLIEILNNISKTIRDRFVFEAKVRALTAEARISAIILGILPFALLALIAFMRPAYLSPLFDDPLGQKIVVGALLWFGCGVFVMKTVSTVEV